MIRPLTVLAAFDTLSAVLLAQVVAPVAAPAFAFGPGELSVVTALLLALSSAFVATAKLLLDSKDDQIARLDALRIEQLATAENLRLEMLLAAEKLRLEQLDVLMQGHRSTLDVLRLQVTAKRAEERE